MEFIYILLCFVGAFLLVLNIKAMFAILDIRSSVKEDKYYREYWIEKRLGNNEKACELLTRMYYSEEFSYMMDGKIFPEKRRKAYKGSFTELGYAEKYEQLISNKQ